MTARLDGLVADWKAGRITNWEFYQATRWYRAARVAEASGVPAHVVRARRRDLKRMHP